MGTETMGKVVVAAKIENLDDLFRAEKGEITSDQVRRVDVADALVDTGATGLLLPKKLIQQLGLRPFRVRSSRGLGGLLGIQIYNAVRLTIQGRDCQLDVGEISDEFPVLIGQIPLEMLDWVVDPVGQKLIGNPEHGGQHVMEIFKMTEEEKRQKKTEVENSLLETLDEHERGQSTEVTPDFWRKVREDYLRKYSQIYP